MTINLTPIALLVPRREGAPVFAIYKAGCRELTFHLLGSSEVDETFRARLDIAMIWQQANLIRRRGVGANVAAGALGRHQTWWTALGGLPAEEKWAARLYLNDVGLHPVHPPTVRGGQSRREFRWR